jgi:hypothetical protein
MDPKLNKQRFELAHLITWLDLASRCELESLREACIQSLVENSTKQQCEEISVFSELDPKCKSSLLSRMIDRLQNKCDATCQELINAKGTISGKDYLIRVQEAEIAKIKNRR